ncbi:unnamed protein product, partial [Amoebophrya sp. A25]
SGYAFSKDGPAVIPGGSSSSTAMLEVVHPLKRPILKATEFACVRFQPYADANSSSSRGTESLLRASCGM